MNPYLPNWFSFYKYKENENSDDFINDIMNIFDSYNENNVINLELFMEDLKFISSDNDINSSNIYFKKIVKLVKTIDKAKISKDEMKTFISNSFTRKTKSREYSNLIYDIINDNTDGNLFNRKFTINENLKFLMAKSNINFDEFVDHVLDFTLSNTKSSILFSEDDLHNILFKEIYELEKLYK